jgi:Tfp pilus assembly protein PilN
MQAVNLLPEYAQPGRRWTAAGSELSARRILPVGGIAAIVIALVFGAAYLRERSLVSDKKSDLATSQARLVAQEARAQPIKQAQADSAARLAIIKSVAATRVHWDTVLADLGRVLPSGVHLSSLSVAAATPSFTITGTTSSHDRVALVLDRLEVLPWLSEISLTSDSKGGPIVNFTIGATYVGSEGS